MAKTGMKIVSAALPEGSVQQLRSLADEGDRTLSAEVRRAVAEHLTRQAADVKQTQQGSE
jgi:predicted transcriptional regulator